MFLITFLPLHYCGHCNFHHLHHPNNSHVDDAMVVVAAAAVVVVDNKELAVDTWLVIDIVVVLGKVVVANQGQERTALHYYL